MNIYIIAYYALAKRYKNYNTALNNKEIYVSNI